MQGMEVVYFSLMGMLIVFCGLTVISLYIVLLPKILVLPAKFKKMRRHVAKAEADINDLAKQGDKSIEKEILTAIAIAFHLDQEFPADDQKMTWKSHGDMGSAWQATGIAHGLAVRNHVHISRRRY